MIAYFMVEGTPNFTLPARNDGAGMVNLDRHGASGKRLTPRKSDAAEMMSRIVAERLVSHLEQSGFVVMRRPPSVGAAALLRGHND
jgi:hypothetical protein